MFVTTTAAGLNGVTAYEHRSKGNTTMSGKLVNIVDTLDTIAGNEMRAMMLIDFADKFQEVPERIAKRPFPELNRVPFCESEAYVWLEVVEEQKIKLHFAVENPSGISAKALAVILDDSLSGANAHEVAQVSPDIVYRLFGRNIGMGKGQGLMAMVSMVKTAAQKLADAQLIDSNNPVS